MDGPNIESGSSILMTPSRGPPLVTDTNNSLASPYVPTKTRPDPTQLVCTLTLARSRHCQARFREPFSGKLHSPALRSFSGAFRAMSLPRIRCVPAFLDCAADLSDDSGKPSNHPRHQKALSRRLSEGYYLTEQ